MPRTAIAREQKQFIKIAFAVHLSAAISAERYRSDSGALKSAVLNFVFFILIKNKIEQSACQSCLKNNLLEVFPLTVGSGKTMAFENRWSRYKEIGKKVPQAYRVYVEDTFLPCDAGDARIFSKEHEHGLRVSKHIFVGNSRLVTAMTHADNHGDTTEQTEKRYYYHADHLQSAQFITNVRGEQYEHIEYTPYGELWIEETAPGIDKLPFRFTGKELDEETGLYYYGARYLDPKYSRWLSGDPALGEYIPKQGEDIGKLPNNGVYNVINLHIFSYANNNPIKYNDPTGEIPTPYEAAIMAEHIYNGKIGDIVEGGWILNNIYQLNQDGGSGAIGVYSRLVIDEKGYPVDVEYALVNRGTSPTNLEDWSQNIDQFFGDSSDVAMSISIAIDFVQNHIYSEVTMVGHSKGGAEAILNALKTGKNAIVFNPAKPTLNGLSKSGNFLQAFVVTGDILHGMQGPLPDIIDTTYLPRQYRGKERYSHSHGYDIRHEIFPHSMEAVIQALKE